jgi:hypothetical protein
MQDASRVNSNLPGVEHVRLGPGFVPSSPSAPDTPSFPFDAHFSLVPFSFSFGNEVRHSFVLSRSFRRNLAGSQATGEENEQAFALEEIRVYKHFLVL